MGLPFKKLIFMTKYFSIVILIAYGKIFEIKKFQKLRKLKQENTDKISKKYEFNINILFYSIKYFMFIICVKKL